ncbi:MAG: periplasmic heavy metal sensor [Gammaproteobacteria bacterium]
MRNYNFLTRTLLIAGSFFLFSAAAMADKHMMDRGSYDQMMQGRGMWDGMGTGHMGMMGGGMGRNGMGMMQGGGMMGGGMSPMMNMLDLDEGQRTQVRALAREHRNNRLKMMGEMMDIQDEVASAYDKAEPDAKAIGKAYSKMADKRRQMIEQQVEMRNKMRTLLNKEQKERFDYMHRGGMGMMPMMGGGMDMME